MFGGGGCIYQEREHPQLLKFLNIELFLQATGLNLPIRIQ